MALTLLLVFVLLALGLGLTLFALRSLLDPARFARQHVGDIFRQ